MSAPLLLVLALGMPIPAQTGAPESDLESEPLKSISMVVLDATGRKDWGTRPLTQTLRATVRGGVGKLIPYSRFKKAERRLGMRPRERTYDKIAEVGRAIGADVVVVVEIRRNGWLYTAHARVVHSKSSLIWMDFRSQYYRPLDEASDRGRRIGVRALQKIATVLETMPPPPPPPPPPATTTTIAETPPPSDDVKLVPGKGTEEEEEDDWSFADDLESEGESSFIDQSLLENLTRGIIWHGHFQTYAALGVRGRYLKDFIIFDNRLQLDLESTIGDVHIVAKPQLTFNWLTLDLEFEFREIYASRYWGGVDVTFGERIVTWGITDFFPVLDIVNPRDYRTLRKWWPIDEKRAVPMIQLGMVAGPVTFELLGALINRNTRFEYDQEEPFAVAVVVPQFATFQEIQIPLSIDGASAGAKIDLQISDWKLSAYGLLGRNPLISVYIDIDPGTGGARVNSFNERIFMGAMSLRGQLDFIGTIFSAEAAYYHRVDDTCADRIREADENELDGLVGLPKCFFLRRTPLARGTVGLERKILPKLDAHVQFVFEYTPESQLQPVPRIVERSLPGFFRQHEFNPILTFRLQGRWFADDFRPSVFMYMSLADQDFFVNPDIEVYLGDGLAVSVGGFLFEGYAKKPNKNRYTFMGAIEDSTHVYLRVTGWY